MRYYEENYYGRRSDIITLEECYNTFVDLSESEQELLDRDSSDADYYYDKFIECALGIATSDYINEFSLTDLKDRANKAWKSIVEFFKRAKIYIEKKIKGQMDYLSVELDRSQKAILFYSKTRRVKKIEYLDGDKFTVVDVEEAYNGLNDILKNIKSFGNTYNESINIYEDDNNIVDMNGNPMNQQKKEQEPKSYVDFIKDVKDKDVDINKIPEYLSKINKHYQKAIDLVYKVSKSAIKKAKKSPASAEYKEYVKAKNLSGIVLNINTLIKKNEA